MTGGGELLRMALDSSIDRQGFNRGVTPPLRLPETTAAPAARKTPMADDRRRVKFDPTINLGHILTFVGFIATGFGAYSLLEKRVTVLEVHIVRAQADNATARAELRETTKEMRDDIKEVQRTLNSLTQRVEPRVDRR